MISRTTSMSGAARILAALLVLLASMGMLSACRGTHEDQQMVRVSVVFPHYDDGYWSMIQAGMETCLADAKAAGIDVCFYYPQVNYSSEEMADIVRQQVVARVDVIVAQGSENEELRDALQFALSKGIRVVLMDTDSEQIGEHLYVGSDHYEIGQMMGNAIAGMAADCRSVVVVTGSNEYSNLQERLKGLQDALQENGLLEITEVLEDRFDSTTFMQCYRQASDNDVLVSIEGTGALTLGEVMRSGDDKWYSYVFGMDDMKAIPDGYVDGVLMQETREIGRTVIKELIQYEESGAYSADVIHTGIYWVTQDNYDEAVQHGQEQS